MFNDVDLLNLFSALEKANTTVKQHKFSLFCNAGIIASAIALHLKDVQDEETKKALICSILESLASAIEQRTSAFPELREYVETLK